MWTRPPSSRSAASSGLSRRTGRDCQPAYRPLRHLAAPAGGAQLVIIVGFDPLTDLSVPGMSSKASAADLAAPGAVMIDRLYAGKLGVSKIGDRVEINGGAQSLPALPRARAPSPRRPTSSPPITMPLRYTDVQDGDASYVLVKAAPGVAIDDLVTRLQAVAPDTDRDDGRGLRRQVPQLLDLHDRCRNGAAARAPRSAHCRRRHPRQRSMPRRWSGSANMLHSVTRSAPATDISTLSC